MAADITPEIAHDTRLLALLLERHNAQHKLASARSTMQYQTQKRSNDTRSLAQVIEDHEALRSSENNLPYRQRELDQAWERYNAAVGAVSLANERFIEHERAYTGWNRYYLVVSSDGLVHGHTGCHTCNKGRSATRFALLPNLSGRSIDVLVDALGPALCSVCFSQAPVAWTDAERIPARLATVLLEQGEDAFHAELATFKAKRAKRLAKKQPVLPVYDALMRGLT